MAGAGSTAVAGAAAAEEKTGAAMKSAGAKLEKDGGDAKRFLRGQQAVEETKKKGICTIM